MNEGSLVVGHWLLIVVSAITVGVFFMGWFAGTAYTWRNVRRTMIETVAMGRVTNTQKPKTSSAASHHGRR